MPKQSSSKTKRHKTGKKSPDTENLTSYVPTADDYKKIFEYNIDAFSDTPDFKWTLGDIEHEFRMVGISIQSIWAKIPLLQSF